MTPGYIVQYWPETELVKAVMQIDDEALTPDGWLFIPLSAGPAPVPVDAPPTAADILASQSAKLQSLTAECNAQKAALTNRVATLQDAIDLDMATPEEIAEKPVRSAQLLEWKRYGVLLGRVTSQAGWPPEAEWPVKPSAGMDLTVSAAAPEAA